MRLFTLLVAAAFVMPAAAQSASTVIGSGLARMCFEAADAERATPTNVDVCSRAITDEALSLDDQVATYVNRGILRAHMSDWPGAASDYDRAIKLNPGEPEAYLNKAALVLKQQRDWRQARDLFDAALQRHTRKPEIAYYGRAVSNELAGDLAGALADYRRASEIAPKWEQPKKELARFSVRKGG